MNRNERKHLESLLSSIEHPSVRGPSYDQNLKRTESGLSPSLLDSPDYKLGWVECRDHIVPVVRWLLNGCPVYVGGRAVVVRAHKRK